MKLNPEILKKENENLNIKHRSAFDYLYNYLENKGIDVTDLIKKVEAFQVAIPSWALGAGGTRFGRFSFPGEPASLEQKLDDVGLLHALTGSAGAISLHIPWDIPKDFEAIKQQAKNLSLVFDAVNSNTFQDQKGTEKSYQFGSLSALDDAVREQAIAHNKEVISIGKKLGSKSITIWLADGSNFPGQANFQTALQNTEESLKQIYDYLPLEWNMFIEYKPFEPHFYSTIIHDWGTSFLLASACGERAYTLVDLGHHLPNTNIEQIVATLMSKGKLGAFHFNDSKYGDDDLTVGSIKPYALFLIFNELVYGISHNRQNPMPVWMIDASHTIKDPLEDLLQSLEAILEAYAKALLIDQKALKEAQQIQDVVACQEILQTAYRTDVRPLIAQARKNVGGSLSPITAFRNLKVRSQLIQERGKNSVATGL